jgi:ribose transport system permease protein
LIDSDFFQREKVLEWLRNASVLLILLLLVVLMSLLSDRFLTFDNFLNIAQQTTTVAIIAVGMTIVMISGGIDLSVGSVVALAGAIGAGLMSRQGLPLPVAVLGALTAGALVGFLNGLFIVLGKLPPFVATLATMAVARGLTLVYTQGRPISGLPESFTFWGTGDLLGAPSLV